MKSEKEIREQSNAGFNCSQLVTKYFSEKLNYDENLAAGMALAFGGGMGRTQKTCGAVTGAYMVIGVYNDRINISQNEKKLAAYEMLQNFNEKFTEMNGTTNCYELLGVDLKTEEGQKEFNEKQLSENICQKCVRDSIQILNEMI